MDPYQQNYFKYLRRLLLVAGVFIVVFGAYQFYLSLHFRIVNTEPKTGSVAAVSPYLKINFNRQLSAGDISLSSSYSVIASYKVQGKTLVINLKSPMTVGYGYYVKINSISDVKGDRITNRMISFTPKDIAWQKLSKNQQAALLKAQENRPPSVSDIKFSGVDALINDGVSQTQATTMEQDFFSFSPKSRVVSIDTASVTPAPHDRNSASTLGSINFNVKVGSGTYSARIEYSLDTDYIRLVLQDAGGKQVYDSNPQLNVPPPTD